VVGLNFYFNNQWISFGETMGMGHRLFRPFHDMLAEVHRRYGRPMLLAETGAEGGNGPGWLRYVAGEVRAAMRAGVPMQGICIYPVMDYPGWDDERHCPCGVIACDAAYEARGLTDAMVRQIAEERFLLERDGLLPGAKAARAA
jgi:polysaccharide biosynthesis protein PelF